MNYSNPQKKKTRLLLNSLQGFFELDCIDVLELVFAFCLHACTGFLSSENAFRHFGEPADVADRTRSTARPLKSGADFLRGFRDHSD